jgi:hypothetical protein
MDAVDRPLERGDMTEPVRQLLISFDTLSASEQHEAAVEILRRLAPSEADLPESALVELAGELFRALDAEAASPHSAYIAASVLRQSLEEEKGKP